MSQESKRHCTHTQGLGFVTNPNEGRIGTGFHPFELDTKTFQLLIAHFSPFGTMTCTVTSLIKCCIDIGVIWIHDVTNRQVQHYYSCSLVSRNCHVCIRYWVPSRVPIRIIGIHSHLHLVLVHQRIVHVDGLCKFSMKISNGQVALVRQVLAEQVEDGLNLLTGVLVRTRPWVCDMAGYFQNWFRGFFNPFTHFQPMLPDCNVFFMDEIATLFAKHT